MQNSQASLFAVFFLIKLVYFIPLLFCINVILLMAEKWLLMAALENTQLESFYTYLL